MFWKNVWKMSKFLSFSENSESLLYHLFLFVRFKCQHLSFNSVNRIHFKYSTVLIIYLRMFIRIVQTVFYKFKVIFTIKLFFICFTYNMLHICFTYELLQLWLLLSLFGVFLSFSIFSQMISWFTHVTRPKAIGDSRTIRN